MQQPTSIEMSSKQQEDFIERVKHSNISQEDQDIITGFIEFNNWLQFSIEEKSISISMSKLQKLFGSKTEKRGKKKSKCSKKSEDSQSSTAESSEQAEASGNEAESTEDGSAAEGSTPDTSNSSNETTTSKNSGRLSHQKYTGADVVPLTLPFNIGDPCPEGCGGKLKGLSPGNVIKITGQSFAKATNYTLEKARCNLCEKYFSAQLPANVAADKYDSTFKAQLCVHKHFLGVPNYRLESYQKFIGIPLPDSTQWDKIEEVANDVYPVFKQLEVYAANASLTHGDDTGVKILSVIKENIEGTNSSSQLRKGTFTTGVVAFTQGRQINLFYSSRKHAGENIKEIFAKRDANLPAALHMCDALSSNMPKDLKAIVINCLTHGRRNFMDIEKYFPQECDFVLDIFSKIYQHEAKIKNLKLTVQQRLEYHRQHTRPHIKNLYKWIYSQFREKLIEPNSSLGKACKYMLKHAKRLTRFLRIADAPLDNNICERALKIAIRVRKNSLFYATEHGGYVGSLLQSLICTCIENKQNPVAYLTALQDNKELVRSNPQAWMPWNYQANLAQAKPLAA